MLEEEFLKAKREIARDLAHRDSIVDATVLLLDQSFSGISVPSDSIDAWMVWVTDRKRFQPPHAVFDNLAASGTMIGLESDSLREALFEYNWMRDRYTLIEEWEETYYYNSLEPYLRRNTSTPYRLMLSRTSRGWNGTPGYGTILHEPAFQNMLAERLHNARIALDQAEALSEVIDVVLMLLQERTSRTKRHGVG